MVPSRSARAFTIAVALAAALVASPVAHADEPFSIGPEPIWFVSAGLATGGTVALDDKGAFVGGELSVARVLNNMYVGFYADTVYDWGPNAATITAGPELGIIRRALFPVGVGIDGGVALRFNDGTELGGSGRLFFTIGGGFALFARYLHFGTGDNEQIVQAGITLKMPLYNSY